MSFANFSSDSLSFSNRKLLETKQSSLGGKNQKFFRCRSKRDIYFPPFSSTLPKLTNKTQERRNKNTNRRTHKWWICLLQNFDRKLLLIIFFICSSTRLTNDEYTHDPSGVHVLFCPCGVWHSMLPVFVTNSTFVSTWNARSYHTVYGSGSNNNNNDVHRINKSIQNSSSTNNSKNTRKIKRFDKWEHTNYTLRFFAFFCSFLLDKSLYLFLVFSNSAFKGTITNSREFCVSFLQQRNRQLWDSHWKFVKDSKEYIFSFLCVIFEIVKLYSCIIVWLEHSIPHSQSYNTNFPIEMESLIEIDLCTSTINLLILSLLQLFCLWKSCRSSKICAKRHCIHEIFRLCFSNYFSLNANENFRFTTGENELRDAGMNEWLPLVNWSR